MGSSKRSIETSKGSSVMKIISIDDDKLNFPYIHNIDVLQEKFDLLFTTARLMGYIMLKDYIGSKDLKKIYYYFHSEEAANRISVMVNFHILEGEVKKVVLVTSTNRMVFEEGHEEDLLKELDKMLLYL